MSESLLGRVSYKVHKNKLLTEQTSGDCSLNDLRYLDVFFFTIWTVYTLVFEHIGISKQCGPRSDATGPQCLPFIQQLFDTSICSKMELFKFYIKYGKETVNQYLERNPTSISLRNHAYSNTMYIEIFTTKKGKFSDKNSDIFHISAQNIDCGYSLEPPRRGGSNEYPQSMF